MTRKDIIKDLKAYFTEIDWTKHAENKLDFILESFEAHIRSTIKPKKMVIVKTRIIKKYMHTAEPSVHLSESDMERLANEVSSLTGVSINQLKGKSRLRRIVDARKEFVRRVFVKNPHQTLWSIARYLNRDHASVIYYKSSFFSQTEVDVREQEHAA